MKRKLTIITSLIVIFIAITAVVGTNTKKSYNNLVVEEKDPIISQSYTSS